MLASFPLPLKQSVQQSISYDMMLVMVWVLVLITMWDQHTNNYIQCVCAVCIDSAIHPIKPRRNIDQIPITHYHGYKLLYLHYLLSYHSSNPPKLPFIPLIHPNCHSFLQFTQIAFHPSYSPKLPFIPPIHPNCLSFLQSTQIAIHSSNPPKVPFIPPIHPNCHSFLLFTQIAFHSSNSPRRNIDQIPITHYHGYKLLYLHYLLSYHIVNILQNVSSVTLWYKCEGLNIMWMTYDININWKFSSLSLCDIFFPFRETVDFSFHGKQYPWLPLWNNFHIKISKMFKKWESCVQDSKLC